VCISEGACMSTCGVCVCAVLSDLIWERHSFGEVLSHLDFRMCTISASLSLFLSPSPYGLESFGFKPALFYLIWAKEQWAEGNRFVSLAREYYTHKIRRESPVPPENLLNSM